MLVGNINVSIKIKTGSNKTAEIIRAATDPDNLTEPPMTIYSVCVCDNLIYTIKNVKIEFEIDGKIVEDEGELLL